MNAATFPAGAARDHLAETIASGRAPHLVPILEAYRFYDVAWGVMRQRAGKLIAPTDRPTIIIVGDDTHEALGPAGFHRQSLRRFVTTCDAAVIVSCAPDVVLYKAAASVPVVARRNSILIETRLERETEWLDFALKANSAIKLLIGTVRPDGSVH